MHRTLALVACVACVTACDRSHEDTEVHHASIHYNPSMPRIALHAFVAGVPLSNAGVSFEQTHLALPREAFDRLTLRMRPREPNYVFLHERATWCYTVEVQLPEMCSGTTVTEVPACLLDIERPLVGRGVLDALGCIVGQGTLTCTCKP